MRIVKQDSQIQFPTFSQQPNIKKSGNNPHKSQLSHCAQKMQNETETETKPRTHGRGRGQARHTPKHLGIVERNLPPRERTSLRST